MEEYDKLQKASDELPHDMEDMGKHYVYQYRNFKSFWAIRFAASAFSIWAF